MALSNRVFNFMMQREGGYILHEVKDDKGGLTYAGVSQRWWPNLPIWEDKERLTGDPDPEIREVIREFYEQEFWGKMRLDEVHDEDKAAVIFDFSITSGLHIAIKTAQRVALPGQTSEHDGYVGPKTFAAINAMNTVNFIESYGEYRKSYYEELVKEDPTQGKFLDGWKNRVDLAKAEFLPTQEGLA